MTRRTLAGFLLLRLLTLMLLVVAPLRSEEIDLQKWYQTYNHLYFKDRLPAHPFIRYGDLTAQQRMGLTVNTGTAQLIIIDRESSKAPRVAQATLLHEMCHLATPADFEHGYAWQTCMHRLATEGAFENLW